MKKGKSIKKEKDVQGSRANKAGKKLEEMVAAEFMKRGIYPISYKEWQKRKPANALVRNVPYVNIYGRPARTEFLLVREGFSNVRIECRSQQVAGSVDEKLPYMFANSVACEEHTVLLVVDGDGFKKGAKGWLADQAAAIRHKNICVQSFKEFQDWVEGILGTSKIKVKRVYHGTKTGGTTYRGKAAGSRS